MSRNFDPPPDHIRNVWTFPSRAWEHLQSEFSHQLHSYFRRLPCSKAERMELVINVLADVFASSGDADDGAAISRKIKSAARLEARRWMRCLRHEIRSPYTGGEAEVAARPFADYSARMELSDYLEGVLRRLSPTQRAALERYVADDVDDVTIAREIGCGSASVRVLRHRAKSKLRRLVLRGDVAPPPVFGDDE